MLGLTLAMAWVTARVVEVGVEGFTRTRRTPAWSLGVAAVLLVPVLAATALWSGWIAQEQRARAEQVAEPALYPESLVVDRPEPVEVLADTLVVPDPADAREDLSAHHLRGCHVGLRETRVVLCEEGPADAEHTPALVDASRTAHWYPALESVAEANGWRLLSFTKSGCQFSAETPHRDGEVFTECQEWNAEAMEILERERPDVVVTSSTRSVPGAETVHPGFVERWRRLDALGIDVIGVRDLPRRSYQGAECVERGRLDECTTPVSYSHTDRDPAAAMADALPDNVTLLDLTGHVCPDGRCDAVVGNVLVFWDHSHMTATYAATLAPVMDESLRKITGW